MLTNLPSQTDLVSSSSVGLKDILLHRTATIGVVGLGYIGLPLAVETAKTGFHVLGFDRDAARVQMVNAGQNYISGVKNSDLATVALAGTIRATTDLSLLGSCDVI